jgi:uridine phosphorylase
VYRELHAADHRNILGIEEHEVPDVLLLVGVMDVHRTGQRFAAYLDKARELTRSPGYLGRLGTVRVGLACALGGPMAALHVHTWLGAGVPAVVQLGWFGALQHGTGIGDVVVPRHAEREDGVSDWYLPKGILADATPEFADAIADRLVAADVPVERHPIYSTPAILAESREVIADWSRHGWFGVDMETAATFAVAKSIGAKRAAALIRIDDMVAEEDGLHLALPKERVQLLRAREPQIVTAVCAVIEEMQDQTP